MDLLLSFPFFHWRFLAALSISRLAENRPLLPPIANCPAVESRDWFSSRMDLLVSGFSFVTKPPAYIVRRVLAQ